MVVLADRQRRNAQVVVQCLRTIAHALKLTVIISLLQPQPKMGGAAAARQAGSEEIWDGRCRCPIPAPWVCTTASRHPDGACASAQALTRKRRVISDARYPQHRKRKFVFVSSPHHAFVQCTSRILSEGSASYI